MVKSFVTYFTRLKNPAFSFDTGVSNLVLLSLLCLKISALIRGNLRLILQFKKPAFFFLGKGVRFFNTSKIHTGKFVQIGDYSCLSALGTEGITIGNNSSIGAFCRVIVSTSFNHTGKFIRIGKNAGIGEYAYLGGGGGLEIGDDCIAGQYLSCHPENHLYNSNALLIRNSGVTREGIKIGNNCWIGAKVTILDGVTIGDHCVIAAGAVVTKNFPSDSVIAGVPAEIIKKIENTKLNVEDLKLSVNPEMFQ